MLLTMLIVWAATQDEPQYSSMDRGQTIAYVNPGLIDFIQLTPRGGL